MTCFGEGRSNLQPATGIYVIIIKTSVGTFAQLSVILAFYPKHAQSIKLVFLDSRQRHKLIINASIFPDTFYSNICQY